MTSSSEDPPFTRIAIVGLGLIGGSIACGVRERWPSARITGIDRPAVLAHAMGSRAIDGGADSVELIGSPDLVVLAAPVRENVLLGAHRLYSSNPASFAFRWRGAMAQEGRFLGEADRVIAQVGLAHVADTPVHELTYGDQRMTELARAVLARPRLVLLDEPAAGLSEAETQRLEAVLKSLKDSGATVVLIDHHMEFLRGLVDEVVVLDSGKAIYRGPMAAMYQDEKVVEAYLGSSVEEAEPAKRSIDA